MRQARGKWITNADAAQIRLGQWAHVYRRLCMSDAPNPNYYSRSAFVDGRMDPESVRHFLGKLEDIQSALECDEWLQEVRRINPAAFEAVIIKYVEREPGGIHELDFNYKSKLWQKRTGMGRDSYYRLINFAERYIGNLLGVASAFSSGTTAKSP